MHSWTRMNFQGRMKWASCFHIILSKKNTRKKSTRSKYNARKDKKQNQNAGPKDSPKRKTPPPPPKSLPPSLIPNRPDTDTLHPTKTPAPSRSQLNRVIDACAPLPRRLLLLQDATARTRGSWLHCGIELTLSPLDCRSYRGLSVSSEPAWLDTTPPLGSTAHFLGFERRVLSRVGSCAWQGRPPLGALFLVVLDASIRGRARSTDSTWSPFGALFPVPFNNIGHFAVQLTLNSQELLLSLIEIDRLGGCWSIFRLMGKI